MDKCRFDQEELLWFGYKFTPAGMYADPAKVAALHEMPNPTTKGEVKSLLQTIQFNAPYIVPERHGMGTFADLTAPLRELTKNNVRFNWTPECEASMKRIKELLTSEVVIAPFDPKRDTKLYVDRSPFGIAACLTQRADNGSYQMVNHTSVSYTHLTLPTNREV